MFFMAQGGSGTWGCKDADPRFACRVFVGIEPGGERYNVLLQAPALRHDAENFAFARPGMGDNTQLIRVRQSAGRHKLTLLICAVLILAGFVGWLTTV
jgi:hypothetical protein